MFAKQEGGGSWQVIVSLTLTIGWNALGSVRTGLMVALRNGRTRYWCDWAIHPSGSWEAPKKLSAFDFFFFRMSSAFVSRISVMTQIPFRKGKSALDCARFCF